MPGVQASESQAEIVAGWVRALSVHRKYGVLADTTLADILGRELALHRSASGALKAAKRRLHRVLSDYLVDGAPARLQALLDAAVVDPSADAYRSVCATILDSHASTRERQPFVAEFYQRLFAVTGAPHVVYDLAAGLNPFARLWMGLPDGCRYFAFDNNKDFVTLASTYFVAAGFDPSPVWQDILTTPPLTPAGVAFLFKMYHCLETRRSGAAHDVIRRTPAAWLAVSFPTRNLHGRPAPIYAHKGARLEAFVAQQGWPSTTLEFPNEVVVLIDKRGAAR